MTGEPYDGITLKDPVEERKINRNEPPSTNMKTRTKNYVKYTRSRLNGKLSLLDISKLG